VDIPAKGGFRHLCAGILLSTLFFCSISASSFASGAEADFAAKFGPIIEFEVLRDGTPVGRHQVRFENQQDGVTVTSEMALTVRLFSIPVYNFKYTAVEYWRQGQLHNLRVDVDDDGDKHRIEAERNQDKLSVVGPDGTREFSGGVFPTSHWNPAVLQQNTVLNTITGQMNNVEITKTSYENIEVSGVTRRAARYHYSGDLAVTAWYDAAGRWIKLSFMAEDGSQIEYRCVICKADG